jgi:membrane-bound lytic murein transglycosylase D
VTGVQTCALPISGKVKLEDSDDEGDSTEVDEENEVEKAPISTSKRFSYKVRSGDNLSSVARKVGVSVSALKKANRLKSTKLKKGQVLVYYKVVSSKSRYSKSSSKRSKYSSRKKYSKKKKTSKKKSKSKKRRKRR